MKDKWTLQKLVEGEGKKNELPQMGRPPQSKSKFLDKYREVVWLLDKGLTIRGIAKQLGVSVNTVQKVKSLTSATQS